MKSLTKKLASTGAIFSAFLINTTAALADRWGADTSIVPDGSSSSGFKMGFMTVLNYFLGFLGLLAMAIIVYAGFTMVVSSGDDEKFGEGKKMIINAIIGLIIIILSYSIVRLVVDIQA